MVTYSANFSRQQDVLALPRPCDVALRDDALTLLRSQPDELQRRLEKDLQDERADMALPIAADRGDGP